MSVVFCRAKHQARDVIQQPGAATSFEGIPHRFAHRLMFEQTVHEFEDHEVLARHDHVGAHATVGRKTEEVPRFVNRLGAAGQDERALVAQPPGIANVAIGTGTVNLHARDEEHLGLLTAKVRLANPDIRSPLFEHDPGILESGRPQGGTDGDRPSRNQDFVDEQERPQPSAMIERIDEQYRDIAVSHLAADPGLQLRILSGIHKPVLFVAAWQFHGASFQKGIFNQLTVAIRFVSSIVAAAAYGQAGRVFPTRKRTAFGVLAGEYLQREFPCNVTGVFAHIRSYWNV